MIICSRSELATATAISTGLPLPLLAGAAEIRKDYQIRPVPFTAAQAQSEFWTRGAGPANTSTWVGSNAKAASSTAGTTCGWRSRAAAAGCGSTACIPQPIPANGLRIDYTDQNNPVMAGKIGLPASGGGAWFDNVVVLPPGVLEDKE